MSRYEFWYTDPLGGRISNIPNVSGFSYVKVLGDVGLIQFETPLQGLEHEANNPDYRIMIYRQPYGAAQQLEIIGFLDRFTYSTDQDGLNLFNTGASDLNDLLRRRIVAYAAGNAFASISGTYTSNQMRGAFRSNLSDNAIASRDLSEYISMAAQINQGPSIDKQAAWKNLLSLLQDMQAFSKQGGQEVFFAIVPTSETAMQFQTYANQPGSNRTLTNGKTPAVFSLERGNLINPSLTYDYTNEANYIYAGGKGQEAERNVQEAENTTSTGRSPFARKERFVSAVSGVLDNSDDQVLAKANEALEKYRSRVNLTATITSIPSLEYGKDWFFGDKVTVDYAGFQFDTIIRAVQVQVDGDGRETISARVELSNE